MIATSNSLQAFPFLQRPELENEILKYATIIVAEKEEVIVREGQYLKVLPLVMSGSLRVFQQSGDREALLYYVQPGETCLMSLISCFFNNPSPSTAVAEDQTEILCVPAGLIQHWQQKYNEWNLFVLKTFQGRYDELLHSFNSVVFNNIEKRIINYLKDYAVKQNTNIIPVTHLALANELGTTRVVVSRILKQFELAGKLILLRGGIKINER